MRKAKEVKEAAAHIPSQSIIVVSYFVNKFKCCNKELPITISQRIPNSHPTRIESKMF